MAVQQMTDDAVIDELDLVLNLRKQVETQAALNAAVRHDGLRFYSPHPKQQLFHAASDYVYRALFAGNRFGKSQCGCAEDCSWLRGERPWVAEGDPLRTLGIPQHPVKGLVITTDWDKVDEIWTTQRGEKPGKIWKYLPSDFIAGSRRNHSGAIDVVECTNGSLLRFDTVKSFMANPQGSESSDWDFIHIDEPCPELMFKAAARGLMDRRGKAWFTLTALTEPWIRDKFLDGDKATHWSLYGSTYDNPYLSAAAIADFESMLTEDEKQCRLHGIPLFLTGLIYKEFRQDIHVLKDPPRGWQSWLEPPLDWTIYYNIDPHPQTPHAVLFLAVSPFGQRFYYTDLFQHCTVSVLCSAIHEIVGSRTVAGVRIDPLAYIEDPITGGTMANEFHRCGVPCEKATKDLSGGILKVKQSLTCKPQAMWFASQARRTLWEIGRYRWDDKGTNKPIDKDDHMMENLYRMELNEPRWVDMNDRGAIVEDVVVSHNESLKLPSFTD